MNHDVGKFSNQKKDIYAAYLQRNAESTSAFSVPILKSPPEPIYNPIISHHYHGRFHEYFFISHETFLKPTPHAYTRTHLLLLPEAREEELNPLHSLGITALGLSHELDRALGAALPLLGQDQVAVILLEQLIENGAHKVLGVLAVGSHVLHDHGDIDVLAGLVAPAVVVGRHADHLVGQLGLAGQLGLGQGRHVDHAAAPRAVHMALGAGAEGRTLHADDGSLVVEHDAVAFHGRGTLLDDLREARVEGVRETDVADYAALVEGEGPDALGAVDDLVGNDKVHGLDLLAQGADGREGDDGAHADGAKGGDVGARGNLVGGKLVVETVAGEEGDGVAVVLEDHEGGGGRAPRGDGVEGGDGDVAVELGEAGAADDGNVDGAWRRGGIVSSIFFVGIAS